MILRAVDTVLRTPSARGWAFVGTVALMLAVFAAGACAGAAGVVQ